MKARNDRFRNFRKQLLRLMERCQLSAYGLARITEYDGTFIKRLVVGERNPSRRTVLRIAKELYDYTTLISNADVDRLIKASGFPPPRGL